MNLTHLGFAAAVADTGSFSKAAEMCHITQPALSNAIALLESKLNGRLFDRTPRGVILTAFGRHVMPYIKAALEADAEILQAAQLYFVPEHEMVRVGLSPLASINALKEMLAPYERDRPGCSVLYKECYLDNLWERLLTEQIDIAVRPYANDLPEREQVSDIRLYSEPLYVLFPEDASIPANASNAIRVHDLERYTFILTPDLCGLARITRNLFEKNALTLKTYPGQPLSYQVMTEWVDLGMGAAILPASKIPEIPEHKVRALVDDQGDQILIHYGVFFKERSAIPPHVEALRAHVAGSDILSNFHTRWASQPVVLPETPRRIAAVA